MIAEALPVQARPRKRQTVKASNRSVPTKTKLTLYVTVETAQRLAVHATMTGQDKSGLVESLIQSGCRRFVVADRARTEEAATEEVSAS